MKIREIMTPTVIQIHPEETVAAAARTLARYNIGALPVCNNGGDICGVVTDRDLVTRCLASGQLPENTKVREIMTSSVISAQPDMNTDQAAQIMGKAQIRRLPVVENGKVCGMVSLGDLANRQECSQNAANALENISANVSRR